MLGAWLVTGGYTLAIVGGFILFLKTPPDVGGGQWLMIPAITSDDGTEGEQTRIASRAWWNRLGFVLLTIGAVLQLAGYWCDRLLSPSSP